METQTIKEKEFDYQSFCKEERSKIFQSAKKIIKNLAFIKSSDLPLSNLDSAINLMMYYQNPIRYNLDRKTRKKASPSWTINQHRSFQYGIVSLDTFCNDNIFENTKDKGAIDIYINIIESAIDAFRKKEMNQILNGEKVEEFKSGMVGIRNIVKNKYILNLHNKYPTIEDYYKGIELNKNNPNMMIMSPKIRRHLSNLMQADKIFLDIIEVNGGFKMLAFDNIPIYAESSCIISEAYIIDTSKLWMGVLKETSIIPLAQIASNRKGFGLLCFETPVLGKDSGLSMISNIRHDEMA